MITVYTYKGKFGSVPSDYIPCLIGYKAALLPGDLDDEAYFETVGEIEPTAIIEARRSKWNCSATALVAIRYRGDSRLGYALADELLTAGVDF